MGVVSEINEIAIVVHRFPDAFEQAKRDWAKFKAGISLGMFSSDERKIVMNWFDQLPDLWEMIRPNWSEAYTPDAPAKQRFMLNVDNWLNTYGLNRSSLGVAPLVIAGVLIAAAFGLAGVMWGIGYIKEQSNITTMIDDVASGNIPPSTLEEYYKKEGATDSLASIGDILKYGVIAAVLVMVFPTVKGLLSGSKAA